MARERTIAEINRTEKERGQERRRDGEIKSESRWVVRDYKVSLTSRG